MFLPFFGALRRAGVPASPREYLDFLAAVGADLVTFDVDGFYYLARTALVKNEAHLDRFDRAFAEAFAGVDSIPAEAVLEMVDIPDDWLRKMAEKYLTGAGLSLLVVPDDELAVHENVVDAEWRCGGVLEGRLVDDRFGIEYDDVGDQSFPEKAPVGHLESCSNGARALAYGLGQ